MTIVDYSLFSTGDTADGFPLPAEPTPLAFHVSEDRRLESLNLRVLGGLALIAIESLELLVFHVCLNKIL